MIKKVESKFVINLVGENRKQREVTLFFQKFSVDTTAIVFRNTFMKY